MNAYEKAIEDGKYLLVDLLQGDEKVASLKAFKSMDISQIKKSLNLIVQNPNIQESSRKHLLLNTWKIYYKEKPPTIGEFLTEKWIGPTANSIYPKSFEILKEYWQPTSPYRNMILASAVGTGKSFMSTLSNLYIVACLVCMRDIKRFFGLSEATSILLAMISFTMDKAAQLLLQPFMNIILSSEKFRRVKLEEKIPSAMLETSDKIIWTTAGRMGSIQFMGDIHIMLASSPSALLGLNMISGTLSEISYFIEKGYSPEYIWRIYNDTKLRVQSRFGKRYFATSILDSSPNDIDSSPIDKYIFNGDAYKPDSADGIQRNYVVTGTAWEFTPWISPVWQETGNTFSVFRGTNGKPAKLLSKVDIDDKKYNEIDVVNVPIDLREHFVSNTTKAVKDFAGWPSGTLDKLIPDYGMIERIFDFRLKNIYTHIKVPSANDPTHLIWNLLEKEFFIKIKPEQWRIYRAPGAPRYLHIDMSETGDATGIGCCHPEIGEKDGKVRYVFDFTITILADKAKINLSSIPCFINDLRAKAGINVVKVTFDQWGSPDIIQRLKREDFNCEKLSVDIDKNIYYTFISYMANGLIKAGRSLYLKNNLKSLQEMKSPKGKIKVDHMKGKIDPKDATEDWELSYLGYYAKDTSDGACGAFWNCLQHFKGVPSYIWEEISFSDNSKSNIVSFEDYQQHATDKLKKELETKFNVALVVSSGESTNPI